MLLTILLIVLILALFGGGFYPSAGINGGPATYPYRSGGWGLGSILIVVLIVLALVGQF